MRGDGGDALDVLPDDRQWSVDDDGGIDGAGLQRLSKFRFHHGKEQR